MRAGQIKFHLHNDYLFEYSSCADSLIADELKVCGGKAIADVAIINGKMHGYEIKSDYDSFQRLENQILNYDTVFDTITLVVGKKLNKAAKKYIPRHWGLLCIYEDQGKVVFDEIRNAKENKRINPFNVAQFLWKEEAVFLLNKYNIHGNHQKSRKWLLWELLSTELQLETLKGEVRAILKSRENWKNQSSFNCSSTLVK